MADIAFRGDPAVKAQALARLRRHVDGGTFVFFPAWEDGQANVIGAVVEADDKRAYSEQLGYPVALVMAVESIVNAFRPLSAAAGFTEAWLDRTPVGADLSAVPSRVLASILDEPEIVALTSRDAEIERGRQAIVALHARAAHGDHPDRQEWKSVRLAAVAASDGATGDAFLRSAGAIVEAAAWPGTMRTVLHDTLGARGRLELEQRMDEIGWTQEDESRVYRIREQAETDQRMSEYSGLDRVLALLDADEPELARRFRLRLQQFEKLGTAYRTAGWKIVELFQHAPIAASPVESHV